MSNITIVLAGNEEVIFDTSKEGVQSRDTPSGQNVHGLLLPDGQFRVRSANKEHYIPRDITTKELTRSKRFIMRIDV